MLTVTDRRIGIRNKENGKILRLPTHYANDRIWNRTANPTPTIIYFGVDKNYFYILPVASKRIPRNTLNDFLKAIGEENITVETKRKTLSSIKKEMGIEDAEIIDVTSTNSTDSEETAKENDEEAVLTSSDVLETENERIPDASKEASKDASIVKTNSGFEIKKI